MTLEELITEVNNKGLRLNNLFQLTDGRWQANVTDGEKFWDFGRGDTAVQALQAALHISTTTAPEYGLRQESRVITRDRRREPGTTPSGLAAIMGRL